MPTIRLTNETLQLIREQTLPGFHFAPSARRRSDGDWDLPVDDEVAYVIATERLPGESDDDVVSRLVRAAIGQQPDQRGRLGMATLADATYDCTDQCPPTAQSWQQPPPPARRTP